MARLPRPVMKMRSVMPAATASSTAYWMSGLSTIGSISFGEALVAGRKRVPRPATGNTAFVTFRHGLLCAQELAGTLSSSSTATPSSLRLVELRSRFDAGDHVVGLLRHRSGDLAARRPRSCPSPRRACIDASVPVSTTILPAKGPGRSPSFARSPSFQCTPAARSCSITSRLCGCAKKTAIDSGDHGPTSGASCSCSTSASMSASSEPKWRARSFAVTSPTLRMPSA